MESRASQRCTESARKNEKRGDFERLFPTSPLALAARAGYACRWYWAIRGGGTERTGYGEDDCWRWLLHSYDGTDERHVSDDLSPRRVGTVRRTRNRSSW